jgi:hydrogenase expression/formation protein HypE
MSKRISDNSMWLLKNNKRACHRIQALLFDFDGTLTQPNAIDFKAIKKAIHCPIDKPILEFIESLPDQGDQKLAMSVLNDYEMASAEQSYPDDSAEETILYLKSKGIKIGIISRNGSNQLKRAIENFPQLKWTDFDIVISRDMPLKPKPSNEGVELAMKKLGVDRQNTILVGDYRFDIQAGNASGVITVLLHHGDEHDLPQDWKNDYTIYRLKQLKALLESVLPIAGGKLPNRFLDKYLKNLDIKDPSLLIHPGVGEDTAAIDVRSEEVLVLKSDPITFVTTSLGYYSLIINCNDIATSGATPRWFLATLLFPPGTTPAELFKVMVELKENCREMEITLCGGHTEITDAVNRPVVSGMLIGTVLQSRLIDKGKMKSGDKVLLTKGVAVEGTAIIASEFGEKLRQSGMLEEEIEKCVQFQNHISILPEAKLMAQFKEGVKAMHDVTEGGLATAIEELSKAGRHRVRIDFEKIPIFEQTRTVCHLMNLNPLGLIGSGSLIICCEKRIHHQIIETLQKNGIDVSCIGEVIEPGIGVEVKKEGQIGEWPTFETDEITRLYI